MGCTVSTFPQPYLGLPLTPKKITAAHCQPVIATCDRYLVGWCATLLNCAGRLVLSSCVLSSLPLHYMVAMRLPRSVIKAIDR